MKRADVIPLEATARSYLTGPQSLFVDSFAAGIDWFCRLRMQSERNRGQCMVLNYQRDSSSRRNSPNHCSPRPQEGAYFS